VSTAAVGHHAAPVSGMTAPGVLEVTSAVLCPVCLGDWCADCNWTGMAGPSIPSGRGAGEEPASRGPNLRDAVEAWCLAVLPTREVVPA